jgi:hypothetical protein
MVLDQRPRIVEQHLVRHSAKAPERALDAVEPGRLHLVRGQFFMSPDSSARQRQLQFSGPVVSLPTAAPQPSELRNLGKYGL